VSSVDISAAIIQNVLERVVFTERWNVAGVLLMPNVIAVYCKKTPGVANDQ